MFTLLKRLIDTFPEVTKTFSFPEGNKHRNQQRSMMKSTHFFSVSSPNFNSHQTLNIRGREKAYQSSDTEREMIACILGLKPRFEEEIVERLN